jgi:UDP-glucose 4-epimerase
MGMTCWLLPEGQAIYGGWMITSLLDGRRPCLTEGRQLWNFLYVSDAIRAFILLAESKGAEGIFNLGSGEPVSIRNVVELIRDLVDPSLELKFGELAYRPDQVMHLQPDLTRLYAAIVRRPEIALIEGLQRTVGWFRSVR